MLNKQVLKIKSNPIGFVAGAALSWWAMKKYAKSTNMWVTGTVALVGGLVGASAQSMISAKAGAAKSAEQVKK